MPLFKRKRKKDDNDGYYAQSIKNDYKPTQSQTDFHEGILSIVDDDIAKIFRDYGYLRYGGPKIPLLAQLTRNLRDIARFIADCDIQISHRDKG